MKDIQTVYGGLNSYQKKLLSANETKRLDAVAKIDADSLTALAVVKLAMGANNDNNLIRITHRVRRSSALRP